MNLLNNKTKIFGSLVLVLLLSACSEKEEISCTNPKVLADISSYYKKNVDEFINFYGEERLMGEMYATTQMMFKRLGTDDSLLRKSEPLDYTKIKYSVSDIRVVNKTDYKISCAANVVASFNKQKTDVPIEFFVSKYEDQSGFSVQQTKITNKMIGALLAVVLLK